MKRALVLLAVTLFILPLFAEEGMFPVSEIHKLNLQSKGLEITPSDIYNPDGIGIFDGICKVGGCTGSFVSGQGLILTNHHCAYRAINAASTVEHDYLQNGFLSEDLAHEIPAPGYTVRVTESYRDVSEEILGAITDDMNFGQRTQAIKQKRKEIEAAAEKAMPGKRAEVSEMFRGRTYVLFIYTYIKDIRLVYAPPRSIGNYGGETDNWIWPRHTGDFSFMRAYVAPDGSFAEYAEENVPYTPRNFLKVAPEGVNEEDFVFILGYPGSTYRHQTADYVAFEEEIHMPYVVDLYGWGIHFMEEMSKENRAIALKLSSKIKGLANTYKNYKGKLQGLSRIHLVETKRQEEKALQEYIEADAARQAEYGTILEEIGNIYQARKPRFEYEQVLRYLKYRTSAVMDAAYTVYEASIEREKPDMERESSYMNRNFARTKRSDKLSLEQLHIPADKAFLREMLLRAARLDEAHQIPAVQAMVGDGEAEAAIDAWLEKAYTESQLTDPQFLTQAFDMSTQELEALNDPFLTLAAALYPTYQDEKNYSEARKGALDKLYAKLVDVKQAFVGEEFIPDANSTLRFTFGRIRGYSPRDGVWATPITSGRGVLEKYTGEPPYDAPQKLVDLLKAEEFGRFRHPDLNSVPVDILYDMDTTGGNSGSAVLNARGELVGLNFDRAFEATINDFAWNQSYSRSIGVDIRYILWVAWKFGGAQRLLDEMGVEL